MSMEFNELKVGQRVKFDKPGPPFSAFGHGIEGIITKITSVENITVKEDGGRENSWMHQPSDHYGRTWTLIKAAPATPKVGDTVKLTETRTGVVTYVRPTDGAVQLDGELADGSDWRRILHVLDASKRGLQPEKWERTVEVIKEAEVPWQDGDVAHVLSAVRFARTCEVTGQLKWYDGRKVFQSVEGDGCSQAYTAIIRGGVRV